jgi:rRNA maturation endonuclease Nob1
MKTTFSKTQIEKFLASCYEVTCKKCGQKYSTIEPLEICYECGADMKYGVHFN